MSLISTKEDVKEEERCFLTPETTVIACNNHHYDSITL